MIRIALCLIYLASFAACVSENSTSSTGSQVSTSGVASSSSTGMHNSTSTSGNSSSSTSGMPNSTSSTSGKNNSSSSTTGAHASSSTGAHTSTSGASGCVCPTSSTSSSSSTGGSGSTGNGTTCVMTSFNTCAGLRFSLYGHQMSFIDFNVISFGNFLADVGDVEGRVAVQGSVVLNGGYSIGAMTSDDNSYYGLIAGNLQWNNGRIYPDNEKAFVAGTSSVAFYLQPSIDGPCNDSNCLNDAFSGAVGCYMDLQNDFANLMANVQVQIKYSAIQINCSSSQSRYVVNMDDSYFSNGTWYVLNNCDSNAQWVINVEGSGDVMLQGASFPSTNVVYNILGSGRTIYVNTAVSGAILSPNNTLNQTSGVIHGQVIVGDVAFALQVNEPSCPGNAGNTLVFANRPSGKDSDAIMFGPSMILLALMAIML